MKKGCSQKGFSLLELVAVITILGIIMVIAVPIYSSYRTRANRSDGKVALLTAAQQVERYFTSNNTYTGATVPASSRAGMYNLSIATTATTFTITADPTGSQAKDTDCDPMTINQAGARTPAACW